MFQDDIALVVCMITILFLTAATVVFKVNNFLLNHLCLTIFFFITNTWVWKKYIQCCALNYTTCSSKLKLSQSLNINYNILGHWLIKMCLYFSSSFHLLIVPSQSDLESFKIHCEYILWYLILYILESRL